MELRQLRYFQVVAEEMSFRRAAAKLNIAQPPLSVQIKKLEQEMGVTLFHREDGRGAKLTHAGQIFLTEVRKILAEVHHSVSLARRAAHAKSAISPSASRPPPNTASFRRLSHYSKRIGPTSS